MRSSVALILLSCFLIPGASLSFARGANKSAPGLDPSYRSALAAANRFLHAWQTQDHETGIMMLTDDARRRVSAEKLQAFFSPDDQAGFEIQRGRRVNGGEYVFPVVLFGVTAGSPQPHACRLVIMRTGKNEWAVNRLP